MRVLEILKRNKLPFITLAAYAAVFVLDSAIFGRALQNTWMYVREMLEILPAVFVLSALITVWVPPNVILQNFGSDSGIRGKLMSVVVGSLSAGPIYAAFPITQSLLHKGASLANVVIIISAWAVVKLPMLIVESRFLGVRFAGVRYLFTVPAILLIGYFVARSTTRTEVLDAGQPAESSSSSVTDRLQEVLPGHNCGACGFTDCAACARSLARGEVEPEACVIADEKVLDQLRDILV